MSNIVPKFKFILNSISKDILENNIKLLSWLPIADKNSSILFRHFIYFFVISSSDFYNESVLIFHFATFLNPPIITLSLSNVVKAFIGSPISLDFNEFSG